MSKLLEVKDLKTSFKTHIGDVQSVRGVSFHLEKGEALGVVGESGCGKSVTMMTIMRLLGENAKINVEKIIFDDKDITKPTEKLMQTIRGNDMSMIFQDPMTSLNPLFTVGDQLTEHLIKHKKISKKEANEKAIINIQKIINEEQINCDFEIKSSYVFAQKEDEVLDIEKEVKAVNKIGKKAEFVSEIKNFPLEIKGAIKFENQAQYHPRKYMLGLAKCILKNKGKIFINTTATNVKQDGNSYIVYANKNKILSKYVVLASHYPFINIPGFYFTKMYQSTSYVIAIETNQKLPDGMFISAKETIYSFRTAKYNGKDILLICGSDHKTGEAIATNEKYKELEDLAKRYYPDCKILFRWNTRDCISLDKIPYIGEFSTFMKGVYVGTGFKKWGMAFSNVSANIIVDEILEKENEYKEIFNSKRIKPIKNRWEMKNILKESSYSLLINKLKYYITPYKENTILFIFSFINQKTFTNIKKDCKNNIIIFYSPSY